jgi:hypothetical protein
METKLATNCCATLKTYTKALIIIYKGTHNQCSLNEELTHIATKLSSDILKTPRSVLLVTIKHG